MIQQVRIESIEQAPGVWRARRLRCLATQSHGRNAVTSRFEAKGGEQRGKLVGDAVPSQT